MKKIILIVIICLLYGCTNKRTTKLLDSPCISRFDWLKGDNTLKPIKVFDNGYFTYFEFYQGDQTPKKFPLVYAVIDNHETPVNTRIEAGCIVVPSVQNMWVLRSGEKYFCIKKKKK